MEKVHAGIIGLGRAGQMHLKNLMTIPEIVIEQVADVFIENVSEHLNDIGITNQTRDYHDILNNPKVDTVFILRQQTPTKRSLRLLLKPGRTSSVKNH